MVLGSGLSFQSCTSVSFAPVRAAESTLEPRRPGCIGGRLRPLLISEIRIRGLGLRIHDLRHMAVTFQGAADMPPMAEWKPEEVKAHLDYAALHQELVASGELVDSQVLTGPELATIVTWDGVTAREGRSSAFSCPVAQTQRGCQLLA